MPPPWPDSSLCNAVSEYLTGHFPQTELPAEVSQAIQRRAAGNPLFVVNVVTYLADQGLLRPETGSEELPNILQAIDGEVPQNLRLLIERQLERLADPTQRLLEAASVVGAEFAVGREMRVEQ